MKKVPSVRAECTRQLQCAAQWAEENLEATGWCGTLSKSITEDYNHGGGAIDPNIYDLGWAIGGYCGYGNAGVAAYSDGYTVKANGISMTWYLTDTFTFKDKGFVELNALHLAGYAADFWVDGSVTRTSSWTPGQWGSLRC
jgi:hypothetical protein